MSTLIFTWQGVGLGEESNARYCGGWLFLRGLSDCSQAVLWVEVLFPAPLERAGTLASQPGPYFLEEIGERTPGGGGSSPGTPFSGGCVWGEAVLLTGYLACGPHNGRPVTARPPAGRAEDVGRDPLGKGGEKPFRFPLFPPVNEPLLPPARAGGRAMRRWF